MSRRIQEVVDSFVLLSVLLVFTLSASAQCDFNNDGYADLAVGIPNEDINGIADAGAVNVFYGRASGITATNNQFWHRDSPGVPGEPSVGFGNTLACGDFDGDGIDDLAIADDADPETITILFGTTKWRLSATGSQLITLEGPGVSLLGTPLAAGDFNGDGFSDLAVGEPFLDPANLELTLKGLVYVYYGSSSGLSADPMQVWSQDSPGIADTAEDGDAFGWDLVAADFGKDTAYGCYDDLAIGARAETVNDVERTGAVHVIYGSSTGLTAAGSQFWTKDTPGIPGAIQPGDNFGSPLAAGYFGGSNSTCARVKVADLVIGAVTFESPISNVGEVFVIYGSNAGLTATGSQVWNQDSPGIHDTRERDDSFGYWMVAGHTTTGHDYLAIGADGETVDQFSRSVPQAGAVHILFTDPATGKLTATGSKFFHQGTPGILDKVEQDDHFGVSLAVGDFDANGEDDLVIGVPHEDLSGVDEGAFHVLYNADPYLSVWFHQNSADVKDFEEDHDKYGFGFGQASSPNSYR